MKDYLTFVWESLTNPKSGLDLLAPIQFVLFLMFCYFVVRAIIVLRKERK